MEACQWLADMGNREATVQMLTRRDYLDLPTNYLRPSLTGNLVYDRGCAAEHHPNFHVFAVIMPAFHGVPRQNFFCITVNRCWARFSIATK